MMEHRDDEGHRVGESWCNNLKFHLIKQGYPTGGPQAGCVTPRPRPPSLREGEKHHKMSHDSNATPRVWHPCHKECPIYDMGHKE